jgi:hypothetical protein
MSKRLESSRHPRWEGKLYIAPVIPVRIGEPDITISQQSLDEFLHDSCVKTVDPPINQRELLKFLSHHTEYLSDFLAGSQTDTEVIESLIETLVTERNTYLEGLGKLA